MLCQDCPQKENCIELCNEAEVYVSQDAPKVHFPNEFHFTPLEKQILQFSFRLLNRRDIKQELRKNLKISRDTLNSVLYNLRQKSKWIERGL